MGYIHVSIKCTRKVLKWHFSPMFRPDDLYICTHLSSCYKKYVSNFTDHVTQLSLSLCTNNTINCFPRVNCAHHTTTCQVGAD
jgi:hypothetical protein